MGNMELYESNKSILKEAGLNDIIFSVKDRGDRAYVVDSGSMDYFDLRSTKPALWGKSRIIEALAFSSKNFVSKLLVDPTWLDICKEAQAMIDHTGDTHHVYLEGIIPISVRSGDAVSIYHFSMGS